MSNNNNQPPPWSEAPPWAKWRAQNKNSTWVWFDTKPKPFKNITGQAISWMNDGNYQPCRDYTKVGIMKPNPNWQDTLQKRSENE